MEEITDERERAAALEEARAQTLRMLVKEKKRQMSIGRRADGGVQ